MTDINNIIMFIAASAMLGITPGPDNIFVLTQSIANGRKTGVIITLGLCTGLMFHTALVSMGVAVLFRDSLIAFNILKFSGAAYLLYLSWHSFTSSSDEIQISERQKISCWKFYIKGIIMNITNPKVSIFFLAFLPQFADTSKGSFAQQIIMLGLIFIAATFIVFTSVSLFAGLIGEWIAKHKNGRIYLNRGAALIFVLLAIKLIFTGQK